MTVGNNITWKKRERGSNVIFPNIEAAGKNISGNGNFGKENQDYKNLGWERISSCGNFIQNTSAFFASVCAEQLLFPISLYVSTYLVRRYVSMSAD